MAIAAQTKQTAIDYSAGVLAYSDALTFAAASMVILAILAIIMFKIGRPTLATLFAAALVFLIAPTIVCIGFILTIFLAFFTANWRLPIGILGGGILGFILEFSILAYALRSILTATQYVL